MRVKVHVGSFYDTHFIADVEECINCGLNHEDIAFMSMKSPTLNGNTPYIYWATCPTESDYTRTITVSLDNLENK